MRTRPNLRKLNENQEPSEVTTEAREIEGTLTGWVRVGGGGWMFVSGTGAAQGFQMRR